MIGRLETEIKLDDRIQKKLNQMPEFVTSWYMNMRSSKKTISTCDDFINKLRKYLLFINPNMKEISVSDFNDANVSEYIISNQKKQDKNGNIVMTSDSYQQGIWSCLNAFFNYLVKTNQIERNYCSAIDRPKNNDLERINAKRILLTENDFHKIISSVTEHAGEENGCEYLKNRDILLISLLMETGMRRQALSEINVSDIDFVSKELKVIDKCRREHVYHIKPNLETLIKRWLKDRKEIFKYTNKEDNDALFITRSANRLQSNTIYYQVEKYCKFALGNGVSPHKIRSGFCSILYEKTNNIEFVRRSVGHRSCETTQRYIVVNDKEKEMSAEIMDGILGI